MNGIDGVEPISDKTIIFSYINTANKAKLLFAKDMTNVNIKIYDITGKVISMQNIVKVVSGDEYIVDTANFAKGVYIINVVGEAVSETFKIVIH